MKKLMLAAVVAVGAVGFMSLSSGTENNSVDRDFIQTEIETGVPPKGLISCWINTEEGPVQGSMCVQSTANDCTQFTVCTDR